LAIVQSAYYLVLSHCKFGTILASHYHNVTLSWIIPQLETTAVVATETPRRAKFQHPVSLFTGRMPFLLPQPTASKPYMCSQCGHGEIIITEFTAVWEVSRFQTQQH